jgi:phenylacetate-coenzyme A ligase PaaK-like adenylate-forming protein
MSKQDLRKVKMKKGMFTSKTSGSTGEPVSIEKTYDDYIWVNATNIRELQWRNWDVTKSLAVISHTYSKEDLESWRLPINIYPKQGSGFVPNIVRNSSVPKYLMSLVI